MTSETHPYIPMTREDEAKILDVLGVESSSDLFGVIPRSIRDRAEYPGTPAEPLPENVLVRTIRGLADRNLHADRAVSFLGAGTWDHHVPSALKQLLLRSEFYTAYTPYQPEVSQGTLQTIFEFQSMVCTLTGMALANASHYDGATALAEAALMAMRQTRKWEVLVSAGVSPRHREVLRTYLDAADARMSVLELGPDGRTRLPPPALIEGAAALIVAYPSYLGVIEDLSALAPIHPRGLLIVDANPIALGLLRSPGSAAADIVVGDAQSLGGGLNFGGPGLGYMAVQEPLMRQLPGRIVGKTVDVDGREAYVLTLQAREQHIRRQRASSNICTNQALVATAATIYLALMGRRGLRRVAEVSYHNAHYLARRLEEDLGLGRLFPAPFFHEFAVDLGRDPEPVLARLADQGYLGGVPIGEDYPASPHGILLAVTEKRTRDEMEAFIAALERSL